MIVQMNFPGLGKLSMTPQISSHLLTKIPRLVIVCFKNTTKTNKQTISHRDIVSGRVVLLSRSTEKNYNTSVDSK